MFHALVISDDGVSDAMENNITTAVFTLKHYHAIVLLDAYIEMMTKTRAKKLYRFKGSRYVFKDLIEKEKLLNHKSEHYSLKDEILREIVV